MVLLHGSDVSSSSVFDAPEDVETVVLVEGVEICDVSDAVDVDVDTNVDDLPSIVGIGVDVVVVDNVVVVDLAAILVVDSTEYDDWQTKVILPGWAVVQQNATFRIWKYIIMNM